MDDTRPIINFTLNTANLPDTLGSNNYGSTLNVYKTSFIFNNVNLKNIMGSSIWNKYNKFNISLVSRLVPGITSVSYVGTANYSDMILTMSGLHFIGTRETTSSMLINKGAILYFSNMSSNQTTWNTINGINGNMGFTNTFLKSDEIVKLQFDYVSPINFIVPYQITMNGTNKMIDHILCFRIDPIDEK
jgi:hypothetical protein